jgi:putative endonuclease
LGDFFHLNISAMHFVYVLYSLKDRKLYKGYTSNIQSRLLRHNSGGNKSTAHRKPFVIVHIEQFEDKTLALKREKYFKSLEGGVELKQALIKSNILNDQGELNVEQL